MYHPQWVQFSWDLKALPSAAPKLESCYALDRARLDERDLVDEALQRAYSTEQAWSASLAERLDFLRQLVAYDMSLPDVEFWVIRHGLRVIGISIIAIEHSSGRNLVSGVCIQNEYRCRGLGTYLLYESLARLKTLGLDKATAVTKRGVSSERFLYPKFGSTTTVVPALEAAVRAD
jgi:N-acetylglutamate synthase-like GNAT family acetyltransferase